MRADTAEAAYVLLDDLRFLRACFTHRAPTDGDVRRTSGLLRRLLLDGHLSAVAGPRTGRISIPIPDYRPILDASNDVFISTGVAPIYGWQHAVFESIRFPINTSDMTLTLARECYRTRPVNAEGLLNDRAARLRDKWVKRGDLLKFLCYQAFGVHYSGAERDTFDAIRQFRYIITLGISDEGVMTVRTQDLKQERPSGVMMDLLHAHVFSLGYYLAMAPDVLALERLIEAEVVRGESTI